MQHLLVPKYSIELPEGGMVREYYKDARKDFDVIFVGDCEVYEEQLLFDEKSDTKMTGSTALYHLLLAERYNILDDKRAAEHFKKSFEIAEKLLTTFSPSDFIGYNDIAILRVCYVFFQGLKRESQTADAASVKGCFSAFIKVMKDLSNSVWSKEAHQCLESFKKIYCAALQFLSDLTGETLDILIEMPLPEPAAYTVDGVLCFETTKSVKVSLSPSETMWTCNKPITHAGFCNIATVTDYLGAVSGKTVIRPELKDLLDVFRSPDNNTSYETITVEDALSYMRNFRFRPVIQRSETEVLSRDTYKVYVRALSRIGRRDSEYSLNLKYSELQELYDDPLKLAEAALRLPDKEEDRWSRDYPITIYEDYLTDICLIYKKFGRNAAEIALINSSNDPETDKWLQKLRERHSEMLDKFTYANRNSDKALLFAFEVQELKKLSGYADLLGEEAWKQFKRSVITECRDYYSELFSATAEFSEQEFWLKNKVLTGKVFGGD